MYRFEFVSYGCFGANVVYDSETGVEYAVSKDGLLTLLVDKEGKPLIYKKEEQK